MMNKSTILRFMTVTFAAAAFVLICGYFTNVNAQDRDPFSKPGWARKKETPSGSSAKKVPPPVVNLGAPAIEQRIDFYKRLREDAAANGRQLPKVTSVLTLGELAVAGIFRTPRGMAAMVEATPIKLTYTIYPGDKFFDGQLVAVEENRLVFRKVTKMSNGKFVTAVENMTLRKYTTQEVVQGTAPTERAQPAPATADTTTTAASQPQPAATDDPKKANVTFVSPMDEMSNQPAESAKETKEKTKESLKKRVKVAKSK